MSAAVEVFGSELGEALRDLPIQDQPGMKKGGFGKVVEEVNSWGYDTNWIGNDDYHGVCSICLDEMVLKETALVKGCEHAYCVTCILRWASCKNEPTCPQCNTRFHFLNIHRALDGSIHDCMFEESVCLLLRAPWFKTLVEVEKEEREKLEEYYNYYEEDDESDEYCYSSSPSLDLGFLPWGDRGFVKAGRQEPRPNIRPSSQVTVAGPSHRQPKKETPEKESVGRRAKRALKREAADKHEQPLSRLGRRK